MNKCCHRNCNRNALSNSNYCSQHQPSLTKHVKRHSIKAAKKSGKAAKKKSSTLEKKIVAIKKKKI